MSSVQGRTNWCPEEGRLLVDSTQRKRWVWFGISPTKWAEMSKDGCEICGSYDRLVLDHDHSKPLTNAARGVLCNNHNVGLGLFENGKYTGGRADLYEAYLAKHAA